MPPRSLNGQTNYRVGMRVIIATLHLTYSPDGPRALLTDEASVFQPRAAVVATVVKVGKREVRITVDGDSEQLRFMRTGREYRANRGRFLCDYNERYVSEMLEAVAWFEMYRSTCDLKRAIASFDMRHAAIARLHQIIAILERTLQRTKPTML